VLCFGVATVNQFQPGAFRGAKRLRFQVAASGSKLGPCKWSVNGGERHQSSGNRTLEPWADTTSHAGRMIMTIFSGIAEFDRGLIRERTSAGREAARKGGVRFGRSRKLTPEQENLARRLVSEGKAVRELAVAFKSMRRRFID
jgi:hypothetical protein